MSRDAPVAVPGDEASFTGERFLPQCSGEIAYEHWHRYAFARALAAGKTVLDVASGEGYGAALLASVATRVQGVDIDGETVDRASRKYSALANLSFVPASCTALPFADRSFDLIVSFETIEHIDAGAQVRMLAEFDRLLVPDGMLILSSPNKAEYSDARGTRNEFHVHELYREELARLLASHFTSTRWFSQRIQSWSGIWSETQMPGPVEALCVDRDKIGAYGAPPALYYIVMAGRSEAALSRAMPRGSMLTDRDDSVTKRFETAVGQLIEQYKLADREAGHVSHLEDIIGQREQAIERQEAHVRHLERLVSARDEVIGQLQAAIAAGQEQTTALQKDVDRLRSVNLDQQSNIDVQQRRIVRLTDALRRAYSWRWWLRYPLSRARGERPPLE
jgi:ubiquinone/menaquinone biosynthesis C-methylase UbiE